MAGTFYISKQDAARDFDALLHRIDGGDEIVVEDCGRAIAVMKAPDDTPISPAQAPGKTVPEILKSRSGREAALGPLHGDDGFDQDAAEAHERFNRLLGFATARSEPLKPGRTAEETIRGLTEWQAKYGELVMDEDFADDLDSAGFTSRR